MSKPTIEELRNAKRNADDATHNAFEALRARERVIAATFKDPYGRDAHAYERAKRADPVCVALLAEFNAARERFHLASRAYREAMHGPVVTARLAACRAFDAGSPPRALDDGTFVCPGCGRAVRDVDTQGHASPS